jgi:hypothetical protein
MRPLIMSGAGLSWRNMKTARKPAAAMDFWEPAMEDLINRITAAAGIDADTAQNAVGLMLAFLQKEGDAGAVAIMMDKFPGAADLAGQYASQIGGGFLGGGVMGLGQKLMGLGLGMGDMTTVAKETVAFAKEKAGASTIDQVVGSIPGLSQFV